MNTDANATGGSKNSHIRATDEYVHVRGRRQLEETDMANLVSYGRLIDLALRFCHVGYRPRDGT
jgi:hypothetical protein